MRVKNIKERVVRLAALVDGWKQEGGVPRIERDLALDELRKLYDALLDVESGNDSHVSNEDADDAESEQHASIVASVEAKHHSTDVIADFDDVLDIDALLGLSAEEKPEPTPVATEPTPVVAEPTPVVAEPISVVAEPHTEPHTEPEPQPKVAKGGGLFDIEDIPVRQKSSRKMISLYNSPAKPLTDSMPTPAAEPQAVPVAQQPVAQPIQQTAERQMAEPQLVGDVLGSGKKVVGDISVAESVPTPAMSKITDLRKAIGINDKFIMLRDLFGGSDTLYNATIDALNSFDNLDDSMIYIVENFAWNPDSEGAKLIVSLIERKLS